MKNSPDGLFKESKALPRLHVGPVQQDSRVLSLPGPQHLEAAGLYPRWPEKMTVRGTAA